MSPNIIQAVAQSRIDDYLRAADRRRRVSAPATPQNVTVAAGKSFRLRRRLRLGIA